MTKGNDLGILILRLSIGLMMIPHGINKIIPPNALMYIQSLLEIKGLPSFISYGVFLSEIVAPLLIVLGFRTRLSALVMFISGIMVLFLAYSDIFFSLTQYGGWSAELPALFMFGALALFFTGGGKYSISNQNQWD